LTSGAPVSAVGDRRNLMTKSKTHLLTCILACLVILTFAPPASASQWGRIRIRTGRRSKPPKPPDRREFQLPTDGEFRAAPTFFAARSGDERCNAIDLWLSSIRYEASRSRVYGNRLNRNFRTDGELDMSQVNDRDLAPFAAPAFRGVFGKELRELTEKDAKEVAKALDKCSYQPWVETHLEPLFEEPGRLSGWAAEFGRVEAAIASEKLASERRMRAERYRAESRRMGYSVGEPLKETGLYRLYAAYLGEQEDWCSPMDKRAIVSQIFKADENFKIDNDARYWARFESEVLPAVAAACQEAEKIYVLHHVEGFYVNLDRYSVSRQPDPYHPSDLLNIAVYSLAPDDPKKYGWIYGDGTADILPKVVSPRRRPVGRRDYSTAGLTNDPSLTSVARIREVLKNREAEAESRKRRDAAEAEARRLEEARQAEQERLQKLAGKRELHRAKAAPLLVLYKGGAPAVYNFTAYEQHQALQNIYAGNFTPFNGDYESDADAQARAAGALLNGYFKRDLDESMARMPDAVNAAAAFARLRLPLKIAYFVYQEAYADQCLKNREIEWGVATIRRGEQTYNYYVRMPFGDTFNLSYNAANAGDIVQAMVGVSLTTKGEFMRDFRRFLKAEGCASPAVRHFELNLHLAANWMLPLQELLPPQIFNARAPQPAPDAPERDARPPKPQSQPSRATKQPRRRP